jgi:predicted dehydrogenase/threonine dehydrogenase-like Zn-dependent dehydrogenase
MKQVLLKGGEVFVDDVPMPQVSPKNILVKVFHSCISPGTEMSTVKSSGEPLYRRVLKKPEYISKVMKMVKDNGISQTTAILKGKIAAPEALGYSAAGQIIAVGDDVCEYNIGDFVACAGAGIANHAEVIDVPVNLSVKIPDGLSTELASTVTLGAIAMQGIRRTTPTLGETVVVVGLGILGQLTAQLLMLNGCRVIGLDIDSSRINMAVGKGMAFGINPADEDVVDRVHKLTNDFGADAVVITAAAKNNTIVSDAMKMCRRKGRVVLVGDVGLDLKREDFYKKELDFFISTSYGPGRYDSSYEVEGQDYPISYVRWTENRNMEEYVKLLAEGKIVISDFINSDYTIENAARAYQDLKDEGEKPLLVILGYTAELEKTNKIVIKPNAIKSHTIRIGMIGAGGFAQSMHLPNIRKLSSQYTLKGVMTRTGANAKAVAKQFDAEYATTDPNVIINDNDIDLVFITTRHNLHTSLALDALKAGKHVFVEKPLAINQSELDRISDFFQSSKNPPLLMTGFNRRFSELIRKIKESCAARTTPLIINYQMNAGYIPTDVWVHGKEGGGRNIGEACHIYDLFNFLTGSKVRSIDASSIKPDGKQWLRNDNFIATVGYEDGSVCNLVYTSMGINLHPKEFMTIYFDGKVITLDDYKSITVLEKKGLKNIKSSSSQKGQFEEIQNLAHSLKSGGDWPISLQDQISATKISFMVEELISSNFNKNNQLCAE